MIFYSVYFATMMLQLALGHPVSSSNNRDVAITIPEPQKSCFSYPSPETAHNTELILEAAGPDIPAFYNTLPYKNIIGSNQLEYRAFRSAPDPTATLTTGTVQIRNKGLIVRQVEVVVTGLGVACKSHTITVNPGTGSFATYSWIISPLIGASLNPLGQDSP
jgi:hypothetical protein